MFHNRTIGWLSRPKCLHQHCFNIWKSASTERQRSVTGTSTIFDLASLMLYGRWNAANPPSTHWQRSSANRPVMISCSPPTIECPRSVNNFCWSSASCKAMKHIVLFLNCVLCGQSLQYVLIYNFTNMHAMSHRSDFFASSAGVNI